MLSIANFELNGEFAELQHIAVVDKAGDVRVQSLAINKRTVDAAQILHHNFIILAGQSGVTSRYALGRRTVVCQIEIRKNAKCGIDPTQQKFLV